MQTSYRVLANDGRAYGPATLDQIQGWIREGRVGPGTQIERSDQGVWSPASSFAELSFDTGVSGGPPVSSGPTSQAVPLPAVDSMKTVAAFKAGASWFYWIAGLSVINSLSSLTGGGWGFVVGLGITQVFDAFAQELGGSGRIVMVLLDLAAAGVFAAFGLFAHRGQAWAFVVGMVLYALDGLLFLLVQDWLGLGFHVFVLFCLWSGFSALRRLGSIQP